MTRRLGWWLIGTAIGICPLAGCAQWGRNYCGACPDTPLAKKKLVPFPAGEAPSSPTNSGTATVVEASPIPNPQGSEQPPTPPSEDIASEAATMLPPLTVAPAIEPPTDPSQSALPPVEPVRRVPLVEALSRMIEGRHGEALQFLQEYSAPTQEMLLGLLPVMEMLATKGIEQLTQPEADVVSVQFQKTSDLFKPRSTLVIEKAFFCKVIKSFGRYERLPEGHAFVAPPSNKKAGGEWVQLYVEFRNLVGEPRSEGYWTSLRSTVRIRDHSNTVVSEQRFEDEKPIRSESFIHDYCVPYGFYVPSLPAGTYTLTIEVIDITRPDQPRKAEKSLEFRVTHMTARMNY